MAKFLHNLLQRSIFRIYIQLQRNQHRLESLSKSFDIFTRKHIHRRTLEHELTIPFGHDANRRGTHSSAVVDKFLSCPYVLFWRSKNTKRSLPIHSHGGHMAVHNDDGYPKMFFALDSCTLHQNLQKNLKQQQKQHQKQKKRLANL